MNEVFLLGNLVADPVVRELNAGGKVVSFRLATNERWKDRQSGEQREKSEFHQIVVFNEGLATVAEKYLRKGDKALVRGSLQTRKYEQNGVEKYSTEVVLQKFRGELTMLGKAPGERSESVAEPGAGEPEFDDSIPF